MNPEELEKSYQKNKNIFHNYVDKIKENSKWDIFNIINPTLIKNPYTSEFSKSFFTNNVEKSNKTILFLKTILKFYLKNVYLFISYFTAFILYKMYFKKQRKNELKIIIDIFALVDKTNQKGIFSENYLSEIYKIFEKYQTNYTILVRPYEIGKNPFKLKEFFNIINKDKKDFVFEYEFLSIRDFLQIFRLMTLYPFKLLRLVQKENKDVDRIFNNSLLQDIKHFSFDSLTRYILGKNLACIDSIEKIYSWSEFQVIERSFNYGIRKNTSDIELIGLQFYLNYEIYFNAYVDDLDFEMLSSPHEVLVNGKYYLQDREKIKYDVGVSLRYKDLFLFKGIKEEKNILLLGSYIESDVKYMIESVQGFENIIFKNHPAVNIKQFGKLPKNITVSNENIYKLFESAKLVIGTASGTAVEAASCGVSVLIIGSQDNLTANPLVEQGKGKLWDIAFSKNDVKILYNNLLSYRENNKKDIKEISKWYRDNFFVEPTEKNIVKVFELDKGK